MAYGVMNRAACILICDDDPLVHASIKLRFKGRFEFRSAYDSEEAMAIIRNHRLDLVLLDIQMKSANEGLLAIPRILAIAPGLPVIVLSALTGYESVKEAMKLGATDYLPKNFDSDEFECSLQTVLGANLTRASDSASTSPRMSPERAGGLVGASKEIKRIRELLERFRTSTANVVITGETGSGKEVLARELRKTFPDGSQEPFVAIDSSTIQRSTAESLLFGYERGAFTGADKTTKGLFEEANGGIIYFDEISNMPIEIQSKLLRIIQEKEVLRLGASRPIALQFRVICATNKDLNAMIGRGEFKDDLWQRLSVLPLNVPPLREREGDVPLLLEHFVARLPSLHGSPRSLKFSPDALECLESYPWPGNVRELSNLVAYLAAMVDSEVVTACDLPAKFRQLPASAPASASPTGLTTGSFYDQMEAMERSILVKTYRDLAGNISRMARELKMDRSHLRSKLKKFDIR